jgi:hypothetical protein
VSICSIYAALLTTPGSDGRDGALVAHVPAPSVPAASSEKLHDAEQPLVGWANKTIMP